MQNHQIADSLHRFNVKQAAEYLGVSPSTIRLWAQAGRLPGIKIGTRGDWRFTESDLLLVVSQPATANGDYAQMTLSSPKLPGNGESQSLDLPTFNQHIFQALIQHSGDIVELLDAEGNILFLSESFERIIGVPTRVGIGQNVFTIIHPDDRDQAYTKFQRLLQHPEEVQTLTYRAPNAAGKWRWFEASAINHLHFPAIRAVVVNFRDIHDRKLAQESLHQSEEIFRLIFHATNVGVAQADPSTRRLLQVNDAYCRITGYTEDELLRLTIDDLNYQDDKERDFQLFQNLRDSHNVVYDVEKRYVRKDGSPVWVQASNGMINDALGQPFRFFAVVRDINDQKLAAEQLEASQRQLKLITDSLPVLISYVDRDLRYRFINRAYDDWFGVEPNQAVGRRVKSVVHPSLFKTIMPYMRRALDGKTEVFETKVKTRERKTRSLQVTYIPHLAEDATVLGFYALVTDITERKQAEQLLEAERKRVEDSERHFKDLANSMPQLVWTATADGQVDYYNQKRRELAGGDDQRTAMEWELMVHPDDLAATQEAWQTSVKRQSTYEIEHRIKTKRQGYRWFLSRAVPSIDDRGQVIKWYGTATDIHTNKMLEQKKDEFISVASHELKTPVTSIKAYAQMMQRLFEQRDDQSSVQYLSKMDQQLNKLTLLIGDLLDVSKIEAGKLVLRPQTFVLQQCIKDITDQIQLTLPDHVFELKLDEQEVLVHADQERIGQVITNLLTNAAKYSPHHHRIIIATNRNGAKIQVSVQDFGLGIPEEKQQYIFQRFYRVEGDQEETYPGMGLGLYIASEIIRRHHGRIWFESAAGKGSTFFIELPIFSSDH